MGIPFSLGHVYPRTTSGKTCKRFRRQDGMTNLEMCEGNDRTCLHNSPFEGLFRSKRKNGEGKGKGKEKRKQKAYLGVGRICATFYENDRNYKSPDTPHKTAGPMVGRRSPHMPYDLVGHGSAAP